jgi:predicted permease
MRPEHWLFTIPLRFRSLFHRRQADQELDDELRDHIERKTEEYVATGRPPAEARRQALLEMGGIEKRKEECRDARRVNYLENVAQDLRYGLRMLAKNPGFTAVAVLTLALGIGVNTAIFSVVNTVLLCPLAFAAPERLVRVVSTRLRGNVPDNASYPDFADWRAQDHVFSQMAAYDTDNFTLTGRGEAMHIQGAVVSADLFSLLGVKPVLGRTFRPDEDNLPAANGTFSIILSHHLWSERFNADPGMVGRTIDIDSRDFTVVGVMPGGFQFPVQAEPADFWMTMAINFVTAPGQSSVTDQRGAHFLDVIARLKPGVSRAEAQAEMNTIVSRLNKQHPEIAPRGVEVVPEIAVEGPARLALLILLAAVGSVLLIACANVASLMLARGVSRQREMAVRGALGASRWRLIRQLLTESVLLALLGGVLGAALGLWGISGLISLLPVDIPRLADVRMDGTVLLFTVLVSVLTGLLFGLAPAAQASRVLLAERLKEGGRGLSEGHHRTRTRDLLVVADVAGAAVLLVGAGLLVNSFLRLQHVDPGFNPQHVLTFKMDLPYVRYAGRRQTQFFEQAIARLNHLPGVLSASAVLPLPLDGDQVGTVFTIEGQPVAEANRPRAGYSWVEPGYFRTVGIPLINGRDFTLADDLKASPVVIINQTLARQFFPHQDPIGKRIKPGINNGYQTSPLREIVGVVGDVRQYGLASAPGPEVYVPLTQSPLGSMNFVLRTEVDPLTIVGTVQQEMAKMDKNLPFYGVKTFNQYLGQGLAPPRFLTLLLGLFAALALALAAVGLYGLVSYSVSQRAHEIGIRMALGAEKHDVLRLVVGQGCKLTILGVAIGMAGSFALTRLLSSLLYGVKPTDPVTFTAVTFVLVVVALLASYIPARRAMQVDPIVALRYD